MIIKNNNVHCNIEEYNCYTYAFNIPNGYWQYPYNNDGSDEYMDNILLKYYNEGLSIEEIYHYVSETVKNDLLEMHQGLRLLNSVEDRLAVSLDTEEIIQFKFFIEIQPSFYDMDGDDEYNVYWDFHFRVFRNNAWYEKKGIDHIRECQPWSDHTGLVSDFISADSYDSQTITFAYKKN